MVRSIPATVLLISLLFLPLVSSACGASERDAPRTLPLVKELRSAAIASKISESLPPTLLRRVEEQAPETQLAIAESLRRERDARLTLLSASLFFEHDRQDAGYETLGDFVLEGGDLTGAFYGWLHSEVPDLAVQRYIGISRVILARYENLSVRERSNADRFICDDSLGVHLEECTPKAVRQRLALLESRLDAP